MLVLFAVSIFKNLQHFRFLKIYYYRNTQKTVFYYAYALVGTKSLKSANPLAPTAVIKMVPFLKTQFCYGELPVFVTSNALDNQFFIKRRSL